MTAPTTRRSSGRPTRATASPVTHSRDQNPPTQPLSSDHASQDFADPLGGGGYGCRWRSGRRSRVAWPRICPSARSRPGWAAHPRRSAARSRITAGARVDRAAWSRARIRRRASSRGYQGWPRWWRRRRRRSWNGGGRHSGSRDGCDEGTRRCLRRACGGLATGLPHYG
jgi:hypothetical protein